MLFQYLISLLLALLVGNASAVKLAPISNLEDLTGPLTNSKRESSFTGDLDLQDFETFFWGAPGMKPSPRTWVNLRLT